MQDAVSLCMIVKNEAIHLARCLESVRALASELIVVDTGSTDETPRIAASLGARVIFYDFSRVDFAGARNYAIALATGRWILTLDADEVLDAGRAELITELVARERNEGYFFERHNHSSGETSAVDYVVRMFPNRPDYRYFGRVHETVDKSILAGGGKLVKTDIRIDHTFAANPEARRRKNHWYIQILQEEIAAHPADDSRLDFLAAEYHQMGMFDEATEIAERILGLRPLDSRAHLFAGVYQLLHKNDLARARTCFEQALRLRPGYPEAESFLKTVREREHSSEPALALG